MKPNRVRVLAVALVAALAVAGCGSSSKKSDTSSSAPAAPAATSTSTTPTSSGASGTVKLSADPSGQLKFDKSSASAKAGSVTIDMSNPSSVPHGVGVQGNGLDKDGKIVNQGGTSTVTVKLKPGKYTFYCPVPGHRQAGMQGTLTVQ